MAKDTTKKIKIDVILKHVDLIIEGLTNIPKKRPDVYMQILIIATFLSFVDEIGMEVDKKKNKENHE